MRVLLVEDDRMIGETVYDALNEAAYAVDWVKDGESAITAFTCHRYDLILLDLSLPKRDGLAVLARVRAIKDTVPIIIVSARQQLNDRLAGLDAGADDYISKPFEMRELLARMRVALRRSRNQAHCELTNGHITLDPRSKSVRVGSKDSIQLSTREFALMEALLETPGSILSRHQLEEKIYGWGQEIESNAVEYLIHVLRKKIGNDSIKNARGLGWMVSKSG